MEQPTIDNSTLNEYIKTVPTMGGYDLASDFGQEEIRRKEREHKERLSKGTVYFDESEEQLVQRM